ncbi:hypothetical protein F3N42_03660 [Marinihelvus fidelis]|uniref:Phage tail protein n=1 Tax=Marinihelvus fidelis TaxID=2613842 RepID=A0A5N0TJG5_9GAMM|nr:hypothetical protein [Marinihelvus fidelis]KAA9133459.1 hypothetical protein F3N42_03660 [Marinihelvus fidelis]
MATLRFEIENYEKIRRQLGGEIVEKALAMALQRVAMKARTTASKEVRQVYNIKARDMGRAVRPRRIRHGGATVAYMLEYTGKRLGLDKFGARQVKVRSKKGPRRGVSVQIRKDRPRFVFKGGFGADIHGLKVFTRKTSARLPIRRRYSMSVPEMLRRAEVMDDVLARVRRETPIEFDRAMKITIDRAIRRL